MQRPSPISIPTFASPEEERTHRKQQLAAAFRVWARLGYDEGPAGHITVRDPERLDHFWVNPFGLHFGLMRVSDLILVNHEGEVVEGDWPVNRAAFAIHSAIHRARPDVIAAAHCHSVHGKAFSSLGKLLDPLTQDACAFYEDHAVFDDYTGVVLDVERGRAHRPGPRLPQGRHPPQPRAADRRRQRRRGGLVLHRHGPLLPRAAAGRGRRRPDRHRPPERQAAPTRRSAARSRAGSASSPCTTGSCARSPTSSTDSSSPSSAPLRLAPTRFARQCVAASLRCARQCTGRTHRVAGR